MEFVEDNDFNELILNFKKLSIIEKKQLTISEKYYSRTKCFKFTK